MSTRCNVCYFEEKTKQFVCTYIHFDGYLEGVGRVLADCFREESNVAALAGLGEVSSISKRNTLSDFDKKPFQIGDAWIYVYADKEPPARVEVDGLASYMAAQLWIEYFYIFVKGRWFCATSGMIWVLEVGSPDSEPEWTTLLHIKKPSKLLFEALGENNICIEVEN